MLQDYDINELKKEAQTRWLKPAEVLFILQNHDKYQITSVSPHKPPSNFFKPLFDLCCFMGTVFDTYASRWKLYPLYTPLSTSK
jgi:CG-1 domain